MHAVVKRGFCISPGLYAEVGQTVDLPASLYAEMLRRESIEPAPEPAIEPEPEAGATSTPEPTVKAASAAKKGRPS